MPNAGVEGSPDQRQCDCGCGQTFMPVACAPHKRFISTAHRNKHWVEALRTKRALAQQALEDVLIEEVK